LYHFSSNWKNQIEEQGKVMKKITLVSLVTLSLLYAVAHDAEMEYEHQLKTPSSVEGVAEDMGNMKALGKCGTGK